MLEYATEKAHQMNPKSHFQRVYAVVVDKKGRIVGESSNSYTKTHPVQARYAKRVGSEHKEYLHAEIGALIKANGKGHAIYVARVGQSDIPLLACPCEVCTYALQDHGIEKVYYTTTDH